MDFLDDPEEMEAEQQLREIAAILAAGYLRLLDQRTVFASDATPSPENPLDCSDPPAPPLGERSTGREPKENAG